MDMDQILAERYRLFCRVICPGLILLGLFLLVISNRTSQFTCQRASGQCTITHPGILPAPKITFGLGYLGRVLVEQTDQCCSSDTPVWFNLTIEAGGLNKSYRLLYAWVNRETASALLRPAADQVKQFMYHSTIPEVTIRLPDIRREDFYCGIFFLVVGIAYTLEHARTIFSWRLATRPELRPAEIDADGSRAMTPVDMIVALSSETTPQKRFIWRPVFLWLWWSFVPWISVQLSFWAIASVGELINYFNDLWNRPADDYNPRMVELSLVMSFFFALLVYFILQALVIRRLGMNGFGWTAASIVGMMIGVSLILVILYFDKNFTSPAYSQGRFSFIELMFGFFVGSFQALTLRRRVAHASWWPLGGAMVSYGLVTISKIAMALSPQMEPLLKWFTARLSSLAPGNPELLIFLWCFSAIKGAILIWLVLRKPAAQPVETT